MLKNHIRFTILVSLLLGSLVFVSCREDEPEPEPKKETPTSCFLEERSPYTVPSSLQQNQNAGALITYSYAVAVQNIPLSIGPFFFIPESAVNTNNTWTWDDLAGNTLTHVYTESASQNCVTISLTGPDQADGVYYESCEDKDCGSGVVKFFDPEIGGILTDEIAWQDNGGGSGFVSIADVPEAGKVTVTYNADNSGTVVDITDGVIVWESNWNADGSGSYVEYDSQGNQVNAGSWN